MIRKNIKYIIIFVFATIVFQITLDRIVEHFAEHKRREMIIERQQQEIQELQDAISVMETKIEQDEGIIRGLKLELEKYEKAKKYKINTNIPSDIPPLPPIE